MGVGESLKRVDALEKVTGGAKYVGDLEPSGALVARIVRSTIANGLVKHIDLSEALRTPGVVKIVTCFDVPEIDFPTPGHPWSVEPAHQDVRDRRLLNTRVRFYGDEIAAVIAENGIAAERAARLVKVEYEEYEPYVTVHQAMAEGARAIHEEKPNNVLAHSHYAVGEVGFDEAAKESGLVRLEETYQTQIVQHCHLEPVHSYAYMEKGRVVVVSATQIPHIVRRVIGQALGIPLGKVRVVKPYIGGGFGNRQDVLTEPLNAYLSMQVGGRPVKLELTREETFTCSRVRHPIEFRVSALARRDGTLVARKVEAFSGQGGYASHGHSIVANAVTMFKWLYHDEKAVEGDAWTVYTNLAVGGAMRGYGIPQADFATEAMADDLARKLGVDPLDFRLQNGIREGYVDPHTGIPFLSYGLRDCLLRGREAFRWDEKRAQYHGQQGPVRRGVGMAMFCYKTGVHPISLETAGCRMTLNQDGSVMMQMGATEIGQGADTVFTQMAAQALGITEDRIYLESTQDTDISPFDTGAYASRQTYVGGMAVREAAEELKKKILDYAAYMLGCQSSALDLVNNQVVPKDDGFAPRPKTLDMETLAMEAQYSLHNCVHLTAESSVHCCRNTIASGCCFAEVEVDIPLGKVKVLRVLNVHDSGVLINPKLAQAQVHGGISMGLGYGLSEELLYDEKGRPLNGNLLDYKLPTAMDTPDLEAEFIQLNDPSGPFGNKALGEPPAIPPAAAVRNAVLHATGVAFNTLPLSPQRLVEAFMAQGLIEEGKGHV